MNTLEWHILVVINWMCLITIFGAYLSMYDCFDDVREMRGIWRQKLKEFETFTDNSLAMMRETNGYYKKVPHVPFNGLPKISPIQQCASEHDDNITTTFRERRPFEPIYNLSSFLNMVCQDIIWVFYADCYGNL